MTLAFWVVGYLSILIFSLLALSRWEDDTFRPWRALGLRFNRVAAMHTWAGFLVGALVMAGIFLVEQLAGLIHVSRIPGWNSFLLVEFFWFFPQAFAEELFCRGFMIQGLFVVFHKRQRLLVAAISAIAFGLIHGLNPQASALSIFGNMLGGVVYAAAYLKSGTLWPGIGLHFGWNFVQGSILGFPVSGNSTVAWIEQTAPGETLLSGGSYGPEAGLVGMGFRLVAIAAILLWIAFAQKKAERTQQIASVAGV